MMLSLLLVVIVSRSWLGSATASDECTGGDRSSVLVMPSSGSSVCLPLDDYIQLKSAASIHGESESQVEHLDLRETNDALEQELAVTRQKLQNVVDLDTAKESQLEQLCETNDALEQELAMTRQKLQKNIVDLDTEKESQLEQLREKNEALEQELAVTRQKLHKNIVDLDTAKESQVEHLDLRETNDALEQELAVTRQKLQNVVDLDTAKKSQLEQLREKIEALEQELAVTRRKLQKIVVDLDTAKKESQLEHLRETQEAEAAVFPPPRGSRSSSSEAETVVAEAAAAAEPGAAALHAAPADLDYEDNFGEEEWQATVGSLSAEDLSEAEYRRLVSNRMDDVTQRRRAKVIFHNVKQIPFRGRGRIEKVKEWHAILWTKIKFPTLNQTNVCARVAQETGLKPDTVQTHWQRHVLSKKFGNRFSEKTQNVAQLFM